MAIIRAAFMALTAGTRLGAYEIVGPLGSGGMGEVYRARDTKLGRQVALKVLSDEAASDPERLARFDREARTLAGLDHPAIVHIYSVEEAAGTHFITMSLVEGRTLAEVMPAGGFPLERLLAIAVQVADAVAAAHQHGIVHRDLKPANIMVGAHDRVTVLDFGLAKLREAAPLADVTLPPTREVTGEGRIVGTIAYMSPEQAEGRPVDERSDVFSLGIVLYEMATGERPFSGDTSLSALGHPQGLPQIDRRPQARAPSRSRAHCPTMSLEGARSAIPVGCRPPQRSRRSETLRADGRGSSGRRASTSIADSRLAGPGGRGDDRGAGRHRMVGSACDAGSRCRAPFHDVQPAHHARRRGQRPSDLP